MEKLAPIKRSKELVPLSRDHHEGLLLCWKIRAGLEHGVMPGRIISYILNLFENNLEAHFREEEQYLFPLLKPNNPSRKQAEDEHNTMRKMIAAFQNESVSEKSLRNFANYLEQHIRFEERILFNIIERDADIISLKLLGCHLSKTAREDFQWDDKFWTKEKNKK